MHKLHFQRALALALCAVMVVAFVGCGQTPDVLQEDIPGVSTPTATPPVATPDASTAPVAPVANTTAPEPASATSTPTKTEEPNGVPDPNTTEIPKRTYEEWKKINSDVVGWVKIADTQIDYPVVLGKDNEYYLTHGPDKKASKSGAIFMDYQNADEILRKYHLILYGHNMRNGTQFHDLNKFKDKAFFDKHPTFSFRFGNKEYSCEVFSAYVTTLDIVFTHVKFGSPQNFVNYMADLKKQSKFVNDIKIGKDDQVLTLITCTYEYDNSRYVVHARMKEKKK